MSNTDSSRGAAQKPVGVEAAQKEGQRKNAENKSNFEKRLTNLEAEYFAIMKDLMKKCGQPLTDFFKVILECSICKGLITKAVSRRCLHTFCDGCLTHWIVSSGNCPIRRDDNNLHVKNPIIDRVVNLFVDTTFTDKEKEERSTEIKEQRAGNLRFMEPSMSEDSQGEVVVQDVHAETSIPGKMCGVMAAHLLLSEMRKQCQLSIDDKNISIPDFLLGLHVEMYNRDLNSLHLVYRSIPMSALCSTFFE